MATKSKSAVKTFSLHWGSGVIEEEAQFATPYHRPTIQLLKFTEGEAKGSYALRFCHYDHHGRFQRAPLIIDAADITKLKAALAADTEAPQAARQAGVTAGPLADGPWSELIGAVVVSDSSDLPRLRLFRDSESGGTLVTEQWDKGWSGGAFHAP